MLKKKRATNICLPDDQSIKAINTTKVTFFYVLNVGNSIFKTIAAPGVRHSFI